MSWDQAINEIGDKLMAIRAKSGPDSVYWLGSAKFSNEGAYLNRKFAAFWGTNNVDHQARICHSTTVAGVANTWGYGAMTNSYNDIRNAKTMIIMGGNPAEAHPVSLQHLLEGKELNRANFIVIEPRLTRTAAHATEYVRIRSGTDIPVIYGMLWHIFKNGWEDKEFIHQRVYGMDDIRKEVEKWTPEEVERVTGVPGAQLKRVAEMFAKEKPATLIWCMGATQHTVGTANVRAFCILLLATGNVGGFGNGANIFRGHCNVQGATDLGLDIVTLPLYYGLAEGAWKHWCRVWEVDYDWMLSRFDFDKPKMMEAPGIPSTRWFDATMLPKDQVEQKDNLKAMMVFGHGGNTVTRMPEAAKGIEELELLVVADPHPTTWAVLGERKNGTYLLPICTQFEMRRLAHRVEPLAPVGRAGRQADLRIEERLRGHVSAGQEARLRRPDVQEHQGREQRAGGRGHPARDQPRRLVDRLLRPVAGAPEGAHGEPGRSSTWSRCARRRTIPEIGGDYYGLPWPCWGTPELKHPGTHTLYNTNLHVMDGGGTFRARFGVEREASCRTARPQGTTCWPRAPTRSARRSRTAIPSSPTGCSRSSAGTRTSPRPSGRSSSASAATTPTASPGRPTSPAASSASPWSTAASTTATARPAPMRGTCPTRSRCTASRSTRRGPTWSPSIRPCRTRCSSACPISASTCRRRRWSKGIAKQFPLILTSGRLVEYEGGGEETRSNKWLAELQQDMFIEINPADAAERGIKDGAWVLVTGPEMPAARRAA